VGWPELAGSFVQTPVAVFPFIHLALSLAAVKFANGRVLGDILDNLAAEPLPEPTNRLTAFQFVLRHETEPSIQTTLLPKLRGSIRLKRRKR
jgi:hypothetical protein